MLQKYFILLACLLITKATHAVPENRLQGTQNLSSSSDNSSASINASQGSSYIDSIEELNKEFNSLLQTTNLFSPAADRSRTGAPVYTKQKVGKISVDKFSKLINSYKGDDYQLTKALEIIIPQENSEEQEPYIQIFYEENNRLFKKKEK